MYGQAVYWIDPQLTALDKALNQLAGMNQAEPRNSGANLCSLWLYLFVNSPKQRLIPA